MGDLVSMAEWTRASCRRVHSARNAPIAFAECWFLLFPLGQPLPPALPRQTLRWSLSAQAEASR